MPYLLTSVPRKLTSSNTHEVEDSYSLKQEENVQCLI